MRVLNYRIEGISTEYNTKGYPETISLLYKVIVPLLELVLKQIKDINIKKYLKK